jgi:TolA-binding protein
MDEKTNFCQSDVSQKVDHSLNSTSLDNDIQSENLVLANQVSQTKILGEKENTDTACNKSSVLYQSFKDIQPSDLAKETSDTDQCNDEKLLYENEIGSANDLIYNDEYDDDGEYKLPVVDWVSLEAKLKESQLEIDKQNKRTNFNSDRDEVRRKLAIVSSSSSSSSFNDQNLNEPAISDYLRKNTLPKSYLGQNLQICFMNETNEESDFDYSSSNKQENNNEMLSSNTSYLETSNAKSKGISVNMPNSLSSFSVLSFNSNESSDALMSHYINLQNEIKQTLSQVDSQVKLKMQADKINNTKPSPIADIVGLPTYGLKRLQRENIVDMNIGQLQVIVNDLCNQIEKINEELKKLLIERDDLYMQQDSILVDIEDVTKRIQEYSQNKSNQAKTASSSSDTLKSSINKNKNIKKATSSPSSILSATIGEKVSSLIYNATSNSKSPSSINENPKKNKCYFNLESISNRLNRFTK